MFTKKQAKARANKLIKKMKTKGWKTKVWKDWGWQYCIEYKGHLGVWEYYTNHKSKVEKPRYSASLSQEKHGGGTPSVWYVYEEFDDPNEAVYQQLLTIKQYSEQVQALVNKVSKASLKEL